MASPLATYGFLNAKLRARISKMLPSGKIDEIIRAKSLSEAVVLLKGTSFEPVEEAFSRTGDLRAGEALLYSKEIELYTELFRYAKEPVLSLLKALSARYEVDTLKNAIRLWFDGHVRGRAIEIHSAYLYRGRILNELDLDGVLNARNIDDVANALEGTPYSPVLRREAPKVEAGKSLFPLEIALDKEYYESLLKAISRLDTRDRSIAERMIGVEIDMHNIGWIVRAQSVYTLSPQEAFTYVIPYGTTLDQVKIMEAYKGGNLSELLAELLKKKYGQFQVLLSKGGEQQSRLALMERALREITLAETEGQLAGYPFTIGIVLAYFVLKQEEIRTLLAILNAKYYMLPEERIRNSI